MAINHAGDLAAGAAKGRFGKLAGQRGWERSVHAVQRSRAQGPVEHPARRAA